MGDEPADLGSLPEGLADPPAAVTGHASALAGHDPAAVEAYRAFYLEYTPRLVRYLIVSGAPPAWAAEFAQDAMLQLWQKWDDVESPWAWCRTVAYRAWIRYRTRLPEQPVEGLSERSTLLSLEDAATVETRHDVLRLLDELSPRERHVMALTYDGDTPAEIADELGMNEATVRSHLRHARRKMAGHRPARRDGHEGGRTR
jgi:RNA polymerase sigma factor (sigma-70 family)